MSYSDEPLPPGWSWVDEDHVNDGAGPMELQRGPGGKNFLARDGFLVDVAGNRFHPRGIVWSASELGHVRQSYRVNGVYDKAGQLVKPAHERVETR